MNIKKWLEVSFIYAFAIVIIVGSVNYIVDPFHQYRVKTFYPIAYISKLQRYINPGFAKNYNYDSIVLGSSTSENFVISDVEEILGFKKTIKLCIGGTSAFEESLILKTALEHKDVKNVLYGLDTFLFRGEPDRTRHMREIFPFYLYDDSILSDYKYLFSLDTSLYVLKSLITIFDDQNKLEYNYNRMYQWQHTIPASYFSKKHVLKKWQERKNIFRHEKNNLKYYKRSFNYNFLNILKQYPNINFIIYFPPYPIIYYKFEEEREVFKDRILFKKYIFETTKELSNVKIYDFQIAKDITHNLNNYWDLVHYHQWVNKWLLKQIKEDNFRVNSRNIDIFLNELQDQVREYIVGG